MQTLSIVIPAFNEAARLPRTLHLIKDAKSKGIFNRFLLKEIWIIDDGSRDETVEIAQKLVGELPEIQVHSVRPNQGKGNAVHTGLKLASTDWCLIADADSATPWDQIIPLTQACLDEPGALPRIAMGSRDIQGSIRKEHQSWARENLGRLFNLAVRLITGLPFKDTQCGFKLVHLPSVRPWLGFLTIKRFAWDVEFLLFAKKYGLPMKEVPVIWEHQEGSRISPLKDGIEMVLRVVEMRIRMASFPGLLAFAFLALLWIHLLLKVSTLDFDESLYRSVSQAMKIKGDPWALIWDDQPLFHKPPIFYWLIVLASRFVDFGQETVSACAARIPSLLSSIGILLSLGLGMRRLFPERNDPETPWTPVYAFLCGFFPVLTSAGVIFDPLQTLALMSALLISTRVFLRNEDLNTKTGLALGGSMALACMIKGLNGLLIPAFAFGLHLLLSLRARGFKPSLKLGLAFLSRAFLPALLVSGLFFFWLDQKIGREFTIEFFIVQHFGRSSAPMEAHSGGLLYHPMILFFGGGFLAPVLISLFQGHRPNWSRFGFPLTWTLSCVLIFTFSATKLPHYTWPAWPALALFAGMLSASKEPQVPSQNQTLAFKWASWFSTLPVLILGMILFLFGAASDLILGAASLNSTQGASILHSLPAFEVWQKALFLAGSLACFVFAVKRRILAAKPAVAAFFSMTALYCFVIGLTPAIHALMVEPQQKIAEDLKALNPSPTDCIRYAGPLSATLSLALGPKLIHNRCDPTQVRYLIVPEWKVDECPAPEFTRVSQHGHLILCKR